MSSASHEIGVVRRPVVRWASLAALVVLAGCAGESRESPGGEGPAVTATQQAPPADTGAMATDTAARQQAQRPPAPAPPAAPAPARTTSPAKPAAPAPAKPEPTAPAQADAPAAPAQDTAEERPGVPEPAPSPTAAGGQDTIAQDTGAAQAAAQDTGAAEDTGATQPEATGTTQTADAPLRDEYHQAPRDTVDQATYDGWKQYNLNCARCHGEDVLGSTIAPHLIMSLKPDGPMNTQEAFVQVVCAGRPELGMPSWCALGMEPTTINEIYAYVKGRSEGKIRPGRPALKPEG